MAQTVVDPSQVAEEAGLTYVIDAMPGIRRVKHGRGFSYIAADGGRVNDRDRARIAALVLPPAWTDVWICARADGHIQATGRDEKGRKQYRYHERWRKVRDEDKYERLGRFGQALPDLRAHVDDELGARRLRRNEVLAVVVALMDATLIRVGNEEYARDNQSYGLTTLQDRHVDLANGAVRFHFVGKSGKRHDVPVEDPRLVRTVRRLADLPGQDLFQYEDGGELRAVTSSDVNTYLQEVTGEQFTSKDFRTWGGTVTALGSLATQPPPDSEHAADSAIVHAIDLAALKLGNTRAVCRKCYVHPGVLEAFRAGTLEDTFRRARARTQLQRDEVALLHLLDE